MYTFLGLHSGNYFSVAGDPKSAATFVSISILLLKYNLLTQLDLFSTVPSFHGASCSHSPFKTLMLHFLFLHSIIISADFSDCCPLPSLCIHMLLPSRCTTCKSPDHLEDSLDYSHTINPSFVALMIPDVPCYTEHWL